MITRRAPPWAAKRGRARRILLYVEYTEGMNALPRPLDRPDRLRLDRFTLLIAGIAVLGAALVLAREVVYGVALSWDSSNFLASARGLLAGEGFQRYTDGETYRHWPPFYPMALAAVSLGLTDPQNVAGPINVAAHALTVFIAGWWMRGRIQSRLLVVWGCLAIALAAPLTWSASFAMSESLFVLFVTLALIQANRHLIGGERSPLLWAAVFTGLAWATRYMGVAAFAAIVFLLIVRRGVPLRAKSGRVAVFALISAAPTGLWIMRNYLLIGSPTGPPLETDYSLFETLTAMLGFVGGWLSGGQWPFGQGAAALLTGGCVLLAAAGAAWALRQGAAQGVDGPRSWRPLSVFVGFALAFFGLHVAAMQLGYTYDGVQERHLSPVYVPLTLAGVFSMDRFLARAKERAALDAGGKRLTAGAATAWFAMAFLTVALCGWILAAASTQAREIRRANTDGPIESVNKLADASETARRIRENPLTGLALTNWANFLYLSAYTSAKYLDLPLRLDHTLQQLMDAEDGTHVVWFYGGVFGNYGADVFRGLDGLETVANLDDGVIFRVNKAYSRSRSALQSAYADATATEPVARSVFDIRLNGRSLTYVKSPCVPEDTAPKFFLHIYPQDVNDLPPEHREHGFHNSDTTFGKSGVLFEGNCWATVSLPEYPIKRIRTGQFGPEGEIWSGGVAPGFDPAAFLMEFDAVSSGEPSARSTFDVYLDGRTLTYVKSPCAPEDIENPFFLHVIPADLGRLPEERREHGFDNRDFAFDAEGAIVEGKCLASAQIPEYDFSVVRTGQWAPGAGRLWIVNIRSGQ